jgi:hypothetical protein
MTAAGGMMLYQVGAAFQGGGFIGNTLNQVTFDRPPPPVDLSTVDFKQFAHAAGPIVLGAGAIWLSSKVWKRVKEAWRRHSPVQRIQRMRSGRFRLVLENGTVIPAAREVTDEKQLAARIDDVYVAQMKRNGAMRYFIPLGMRFAS